MLKTIFIAIISGSFGFLLCALLTASKNAERYMEEDVKKNNKI
ncbi:hypothetical protein OXPF_12790 [Oxobacter pfennigii]|uniref:Uncharacterized protein n=1 Tax=Oxobacter pfennigii TaxID=36849 RepID=A0A0N8NTL3_9CLOT|nr:hypothetical protein [Oxobacter pfennigii]KPU45152.1 hypothetical protein OXPF_12790 [Oxobacter pfennigii]